jgi:glycosyltransferase involved in cell wall biosynthesis
MKRELPLISVITVCFNAANLLKKTIDSVLEQTYHAIEYIIIDGASGDDTTEVVKAYKSDVDIFICEPDNGIYDAMNKGIKQATGDLIIFPSWLKHGSNGTKNMTKNRIVISANSIF